MADDDQLEATPTNETEEFDTTADAQNLTPEDTDQPVSPSLSEPVEETPQLDLNDSSLSRQGREPKKQEKTPYALGAYQPGMTPVDLKEAEKFTTPTLSEAIHELEFTNQNHDHLMGYSAWSKNQSYIESLAQKGPMLSESQYQQSPYFRPGIWESYGKAGLSTGQASELSHQYDVEQTTAEQLKNLNPLKQITADFASGFMTGLNDPFTTAGFAIGAAASPFLGIEAIPLAITRLAPELPAILGRTAAASVQGGVEMGVASTAPALLYAHNNSPVKGVDAYVNAAKEIGEQTVYGMGYGAAFHAGLAEPLSLLKGFNKPSDAVKNASSGADAKATADQVVNSAQDAANMNVPRGPVRFQDMPADLKEKYPTEAGREPNAKLSDLKNTELTGEDKNLPTPTDTNAEVQNPEAWKKSFDNARDDLQTSIDTHNEKFSDIDEKDLHQLDANKLLDELSNDQSKSEDYLKSDDALPYIKKALNYAKDPEGAKKNEAAAYNAIKNGDEETLVDQSIAKAEKSIQNYADSGNTDKEEAAKQTLQVLKERKQKLSKAKDFTGSLDNVHEKMQNYFKVRGDVTNAVDKDSVGNPLVSYNMDQAILTKARLDMFQNKNIDVRGLFKIGLSDSPLLKKMEAPEGFEDLKYHANHLLPTTKDMRGDFQGMRGDTEGVAEKMTDEDVANEMDRVDREFDRLPEDIKEEYEEPVNKDFLHKTLEDIHNCIVGE